MPDLLARAALPDDLRSLCRKWLAPREFSVEPLSGGFSGAPLYLVRTSGSAHVLKAFAAGTSPSRARFVHALMHALRQRGVPEVPELLTTPSGDSFLADGEGRLWEMQAFVSGHATALPSSGQLESALTVLARLHAAAAAMPENPPDTGPSPGLARRVEQARSWLRRPWQLLQAASDTAAAPLAPLARARLRTSCDLVRMLDGERIVASIAALEPRPMVRQSVLRDVWAAHVLFDPLEAERVAGIIDLHAAATDTPAIDLARLLGSWMTAAATAPEWWIERLRAYGIPQQADGALRLVPFLAATGILFGLDNWFRWILEAGRTFERPGEVAARIDWLVTMLPTALEILANRRLELGLTAENCSL